MPDLPYSNEVSDARIKRLMAQVGMPDSTSLMLAMKQLENEVRLEVSPVAKRITTASPLADMVEGAFLAGEAKQTELVTENTKLIEALHQEREAHGDTCVTLGMVCQALGFDIGDSDKALPAVKALIEEKETAEKVLVLIGEKAVVDFDDPTVGQVDAVVKDREKYKDWLKAVLRPNEEVVRLQTWVNDLQSSKYVNCVYCGHRYGPQNETPVAMADVLKAHIIQCPKHPLSLATKALSCLVEAKRLKEASGKTPEYEKARDAAWKLADEALKVAR